MGISHWEILIIVGVIAILFGAKKIPELARSIGKAKGEFKKGVAEGETPDKKEEAKAEEPAKELV